MNWSIDFYTDSLPYNNVNLFPGAFWKSFGVIAKTANIGTRTKIFYFVNFIGEGKHCFTKKSFSLYEASVIDYASTGAEYT